ncbi:MAG: DUF4198 domain-containing protein [Gammaproteobacteria bacterium]
MTRPRIRTAWMLLGLVVGLGGARAHAHEFWVEPAAFRLGNGERLGVRLCVGDGFDGWSLPRSTERIEKFAAIGPAGERPVVGLEGADPAGVVRLATPGFHVIAYRSNRAFQSLTADRFDEHLRDKGLDRIAALRKKHGASRGKVREAYSRHAKALIRVRDDDVIVVDRPIGFPLEFVAEPDLLRRGAGNLQSFQLLYRGKPLAGALVTAARLGTADEDLKVRTDADGRATFRLHAAGQWRIAAVHMIEAPRHVDADWESLWASLTFELPSPSGATAPQRAAARDAWCRNRLPATPLVAGS